MRAGAHNFIALSQPVIVDCGAGVQLLCQHTPPRSERMRRVAVIIHGWEGSADSTYLLSSADKLWKEGYRIVRVNLRDHGNSHHLNEDMFHSCRLDEVIGAVRWVQQVFTDEQLYLCGFSLGGNFALRITARAAAEDLSIGGVVAVCPVLDPACTLAALDNGAFIYRYYFLKKWRASLEKKKAAFPLRYDFAHLKRFNTLTEMTDYFVRHYTEYTSLQSYLQGYALTGNRLLDLQTPAHILLAEDDPVIPVADISKVEASDYLQVVQSRYGGHGGFINGYDLHSWVDDYIVDSFAGSDTCS
ncbi:MAG: alpha/beta fold hydrolase [Gammaproteobacteria bacterium]|nr:alpha/beta fold hydrolase [Gammaproteobacteria bacterium]